MASTISAHPSLPNHHRDASDPRVPSPSAAHKHRQSDPSLLSPGLSRVNSDSVSPAGDHFETPAASISTVSHYQPSEFGDLDGDPFCGANFNDTVGQGPSFLDVSPDWGFAITQDHSDPSLYDYALQSDSIFTSTAANSHPGHHAGEEHALPMTPDQTASIHTTSPHADPRSVGAHAVAEPVQGSISPQELQKPFRPASVLANSSQLTPSQSSSGRSSEDGHPPVPKMLSPRVTVSVWDGNESVQTRARTFEEDSQPAQRGIGSAGDLMSSGLEQLPTSAPRDLMGSWRSDSASHRRGVDPNRRTADEVPSLKDRDQVVRNEHVNTWLTNSDKTSVPQEKPSHEIERLSQSGGPDDEIALGDATENKPLPGQLYFTNGVGQMTEDDYSLLASNDKWGDAPMLSNIRSGVQHQPQTSQAAIDKFNQMYRDTDSVLSRAATWGTRRLSLPSISDFDIQDVTSGNILKKLSISGKSGGIMKELRGLVRRPSASTLKKRPRSGSNTSRTQASPVDDESTTERQDSSGHLSLPPRTSSWGKKPTVSIAGAFLTMGGGAAAIGGSPHQTRSGSISGGSPAPPAAPPSRNRGLSVNLGQLRRPRSVSELPRSGLIGMLEKSGGPPVPALSKTRLMDPADDDDDDDDDFQDDGDLRTSANLIDEITPNFAGFQQHVLMLNPTLNTTNSHLVDRIAHQQIVRYKHLLSLRVKHLGLGANCPCGTLCLDMGGSANVLDTKGDAKGLDPLSAHPDDEDGGLAEGAITQESFPVDIPLPPTDSLPAEFECQLCYAAKKFQKPSDWTKHVHEDVQPFTCTWDKCREPKIFKRKADWVRHENEGHRHLEWWTCNVEDCHHTCYRRDNFLQHLVREHKFSEPKVKTKAAVKRAGGNDPTWQKVEQCHMETPKRPQEEPCKFCGKTFPTWKKLTVHLAKHMEQMSLPVLRLVAAKAEELAADTIISPMQDLPMRSMMPGPGEETTPVMAWPPHNTAPAPGRFPTQQPYDGVYTMPQQYYQQPYNVANQPSMTNGYVNMNPAGFDSTRDMANMPVTTAPFVPTPHAFMPAQETGLEPFPSYDNALGLQETTTNTFVGPQMGAYEGMMVASSGHASPFSGHGSVSPFARSPHHSVVNHGTWDERQSHGFMG